jgi:hypothetical protein
MRVPDLNWPADLFDDVAVPAESSFVPPLGAGEPIWPEMQTRWTSRKSPAEGRVPPFRTVLRTNGFGEAA